MKISVLKFGGSSLSNSDKFIYVASRIKKHLTIYKKLIVILSAPANITDDLIKLSNSILKKQISPNILQIGELLSIYLMENALKRKNIKTIAINHYQLPIIAEGKENDAKIISIDKQKLYNYFKKNDVLLVPGFIACDKNLNVMTLGRGGSDYTATYIASLFSCPCYLYTDVKGIYSSDPSIIEDALKIDVLSYDELNNIIRYAGQVRQTKAIKLASEKKIKLYIGSTFHINEKPTLITPNKKNIKIKFINFKKIKNKTTKIYIIGNYIEKRQEIHQQIISNLKNPQIKIRKDIIEVRLKNEISLEKFREIHNSFIFR
ncbi:MAG: hypothetical protein N2446_02240 [Elusimicrobiales bacterium]|nr:hypothetical protein [Elusimicrobiales bacterium]